MARQWIHQPELLAEIDFAGKNQQRAMGIYDQRIRLFVERLVAFAAPIHKYRHIQRNTFGATPVNGKAADAE